VPPRLADGVELIGTSEGSGFKNPPALARRGDGQMVQLTPLLYAVAHSADGQRDYAAMAEVVAEEVNRGVSPDNVRTLVNDKLRPLGILAGPDGSTPALEKPDPLLALKFRKAIIPERASYKVARLFKPLFFPPIILAVLVGLTVFDIWLFGSHGIAQGFRQSLQSPGFIMLILALVVVSAGWHEFGHAAGCAYGGAKPGAMGAGIYLAYPAFYTDVTDSYRLDKRGRLRTDLAGVYFNALFILITAAVYAVTGFEPLLLVIVTQHIEAVHQLLPFLRLDGYYVLADATGVYDLFARIRPILVSALPWKNADPRVLELKAWVRVVVTLWVVLVIPLLLLQIGMILLHLPRIFATAWDSLGKQYDTVTKGLGDGKFFAAGIGIVQALILILPLLGITLTFGRLGRRMAVKGWKATEGSAAARLALCAVTVVIVGGLAYTWLPNGDYTPIKPGEKGTLGEGLRAVAKVPTGKPSLVPAEKAAERSPEGGATTTTTTTPKSGVSTTVAPSGSATTAPAADGPATTATTTRVRDTVAPTTTPRPTTTVRAATTTTAGG
jgi:putative peptide zinc metalloprotease protein